MTALALAPAPLRPFHVIAWITAAWWGSTPYDETVWAHDRAEAMQRMEERLTEDGAVVRAITCHEEVTS